MFIGETITSGASDTCECGIKFEFQVMYSTATKNYYIGTVCNNPKCKRYGISYTRETNYFESLKEAQDALQFYNETGLLLGIRK